MFCDARELAEKLQTALKAKDEKTIIELIPHRKLQEKQEIRSQYSTLYNVDIINDIEKNLSGNFRAAVMAMFETPIDYDCKQLRKAVKGIGTNEDTLIEILSTRSPEVIRQIKKRYPEIFPGRSLEADIKDDTSGHFRKLLLSLLAAERAENRQPDPKKCQEKAKALYEKGEKIIGTDEDLFIEIFTKKSYHEFAMIAQAYNRIAGHTILEGINKEFSFNTKKCLIAITYGFLSPSEFFAMKLKQSVKGLGTDNNLLIRVLVTRKEKDISIIKNFYKKLYKVDMIEDIKKDTSGNFQKLLIEFATY